ncbi:TIGR01777 family oxidoreductase [Salidesulfovibrio brasiliensis]|uniref:TIGR01777 family oxidoreductase n=1 Tax=Salidesulfovibrio brasiliensis TaxID=221711 RepID=UPI0006D2A879|nr:TIGR01777 family oxidoreductase [Salidesulfovibrio brasiliensis]
MRTFITGGTGFIGQSLAASLLADGHEVMVISRSTDSVDRVFGKTVSGFTWDGGEWPSLVTQDSAIVNLAGSSIAEGRWTPEVKKRILQSRLGSGKRLLEGLRKAPEKPAVFVQGSAVGYYGHHRSTPVTEDTAQGEGFLADVAGQWEASTAEAEEMGIRRVMIRTGMVLGQGGALERMLPPFRFFVGGPIGSGEQGVSWIHMHDEVGAIRFLMEHPETQGPYNLTAPTPVSFSRFARVLGETLNRPHWLRTPGFALRMLFGEMADEVLLNGQFALPERLQQAGYEFRFPMLKDALPDILSRP